MTELALAASSRVPLVLIVEDDPETRQFYSHALERHGFRTEQAHNGHQAFQKALSPVIVEPVGVSIALVRRRDRLGRSALDYAAEDGRTAVVRILVERGTFK